MKKLGSVRENVSFTITYLLIYFYKACLFLGFKEICNCSLWIDVYLWFLWLSWLMFDHCTMGIWPLCWSSMNHTDPNFSKKPFLSHDLVWLWHRVVLCIVRFWSQCSCVREHDYGMRIVKENFVGIPWSWGLCFSLKGEVYTYKTRRWEAVLLID